MLLLASSRLTPFVLMRCMLVVVRFVLVVVRCVLIRFVVAFVMMVFVGQTDDICGSLFNGAVCICR